MLYPHLKLALTKSLFSANIMLYPHLKLAFTKSMFSANINVISTFKTCLNQVYIQCKY